jgi:hypothetical protein
MSISQEGKISKPNIINFAGWPGGHYHEAGRPRLSSPVLPPVQSHPGCRQQDHQLPLTGHRGRGVPGVVHKTAEERGGGARFLVLCSPVFP